jgi:polygalacturonase
LIDVRELGAKGNGTDKDTKAIQAAVDKASLSGGTVILTPGTYLSGTIRLRSNV